jgi:hypothetical protein
MNRPPEKAGKPGAEVERASERPDGQRQGDRSGLARVVVFVDLLGFAALTEKWSVDAKGLLEGSRSLSFSVADEVLRSGNELTRAFSSFHSSVELAVTFARMQRPLTAITFSDSVFIATAHPSEATSLAVELVRSAISQDLPVRVGIALGSFAAIRFRSDITPDGGDHAALFLGTAVVRAYQAERCGIKGIRILLHPSVEPLFLGGPGNASSAPAAGGSERLLRCAEAECGNQAGVQYELNYWDLAPSKEREAWHAIQDMWERAPEHAREHYEATANAVNRMRVAEGQPSLQNLRRRTLPRRRD